MASSAEERVRAALAAEQTPTLDDMQSVLAQLDSARAESESRWQAIGRLAPAAKKHRAESQRRGRQLTALRAHLSALEPLVATLEPDDANRLAPWLARARGILASDD